MTSFLLCDDHALVLDALSLSIETSWPGARVTKCRNYSEAWLAARAGSFDLCVCDVNMPGGKGIEGIQELLRVAPNLPVVAITGSSDTATIIELLRTGIRGVISKTLESKTIEAAIRFVLAGGLFLPAEVRDIALAKPQGTNGALSELTARQQEVLALMAAGHSNKEIARRLSIQPSTVNSHADELFARLGVSNRAAACAAYLAGQPALK